MSYYTDFPGQCKTDDDDRQSNAFRVTAARRKASLTPADFQQADLLLARLYDAAQNAERVCMKLNYIAMTLRRQLISCDSAIGWLQSLDLLNYIDHPAFFYLADLNDEAVR